MIGEVAAALEKMGEVSRAASMTPEAFRARRLERFRKLVRYANAHSPYYADLIRERGIDPDKAAPADFPVLTKSVLMANFDRIVTDRAITKQGVAEFLERSHDPLEKFLGRYRVIHTSGTSGEVGYFLYSNTDWMRAAFAGTLRERAHRIRRRMGSRGGRMRVAFYGATGGHFAGVTIHRSGERFPFNLLFDVRAFEINAPLPGTLAALNEFQPDVLSGYTTALKMLGEKQSKGELSIAPVAIACSGEMVTRADMDFLGRAFPGARVASAYVCTEHLSLGVSDTFADTMRLNDHDLMFEFEADHSRVTNLFNYTTPLIRYRMSDVLTPVAEADARPLLIKTVVGRTELMPTFKNADGVEDFVSAHIIVEIFAPGLMRFQMRLTGPSAFRFLVVLDPGLDAAGRAGTITAVDTQLKRVLAAKGLQNVTFDIVTVEDLPLDPRTRKFRLIVDERAA